MKKRKLIGYGVAAAALIGAAGASAQTWFPSKYGAADEIGAANNLSPAGVLAASKLIKTGKTYRLAVETSSKTPTNGPHRTYAVTITQPDQPAGGSFGPTKTNYNDDQFAGWIGIGTQIDGIGHIGIDNVYYNGKHAKDFVHVTGLKKYGTENLPAIVTRGVVLDMAGYLGVDIVKEGTAFNVAEIEGAAKKQGVTIGKGDVVLFHTGWLNLIGKDDKRFAAGEPGLGVEGAKYLAGKQVVAVGADNCCLEAVPFEKDKGVFEVHQILIPMNGVYILEYVDTRELVKDKAWEFMFVLGAPRMVGTAQMIVNPIAIR